MLLVPLLVFVAFSILTMLIVWKGSPKLKLNTLSTGTTVGAIFELVVLQLLSTFVCLPILQKKIGLRRLDFEMVRHFQRSNLLVQVH